ncbi:MAG: Crp/Fnr family transcriptional regulator [Chloroflexota bacterium]
MTFARACSTVSNRLLRQPGDSQMIFSDTVSTCRHYDRGIFIPTAPDQLLKVEEGVVAQLVVHSDGAEVLLGFYGPGQLIVPHPTDSCYIYYRAHTDVTAHALAWSEAHNLPGLVDQLRARIWQQEAWTALQAHPANEERLLGFLTLLTEQFGRATENGTLLDLRITHQQLASAIGVTRPTITRLISILRRRQLLSTVGVGNQERFLLHHKTQTTHS